MRDTILYKLEELERANDVCILYACESGSRAWGFASPDSDYDVRFIYLHNKNRYLSITELRDVIELPVNEVLDIGGWDIRKALKLFLKSNAVVYEWLQSPIVYKADEAFHQEMMSLMPAYFSKRAAMHHYVSMAHATFTNDLKGSEVKLKKYFYALRPLLAAKWIAERNEVPPMEFKYLRQLVTDADWNQAIDDLLEKKKQVDEKGKMPPVPLLQQFIEDELKATEAAAEQLDKYVGDVQTLDVLFRKLLP